MPPPRSRRPPRARAPRGARRRPPRRTARRSAPSRRRPRARVERTSSSASSREARALGALAGDDEHEPRVVRGRDGADEHVEPLLRREPRDGEHDDVLGLRAERATQLRPAAGEPIGLLAEVLDVDVFAKTRTRSGCAPRAIIESRASVPVTRSPAARSTIGGTTVPFTVRRHPARGPSSWLSTTSRYGTSLIPHQVIAACAANVLQPETTTTSGCASVKRADDSRRHRVVVVQDALRSGKPEAAQEDGAVLRLDAPRPAGDGAGGVDHRQVDLRAARRRGRGAAPGTASARERPPRRGSERRWPFERRRNQPSASRRVARAAARRGDAPACEWAEPGSSRSARAVRRARDPAAACVADARDVAGSLCAGACPVSSLEGAERARDTRRRPLRTRRRSIASAPPTRHASSTSLGRELGRERPRSRGARPAADTRAEARDGAATPERRGRGRGRAGRAGCRRPRRRAGATTARSPRSPRSSCRSGARSARGDRDRRAPTGGRTAS